MRQEQKNAIRKPLKSFPEWCSTHGIPYIARSTKKFWIWFWVIATLVASGILIWQTVILLKKFFSFPVTIQYELKFDQHIFPAVTVCNLNPYKKSVAYNFPKIERLMVTYDYMVHRVACDADSRCSMETNQTLEQYREMYGLVDINDTTAIQSIGRNLLGLESAGYNLSEAVDSLDEFILSCSFNTDDCDMKNDWTSYIDARMGSCFTFNLDQKYFVHRAGPNFGLRIIMRTNISEFLPIADTAGMRVLIHDQTETPFPDVFGYNVEIGMSTSIGVVYTEMSRETSPYGTCSNNKPYGYLYNLNYDAEGCHRSMSQQDFVTKCGCYDPSYPKPTYSNVSNCVIPSNLNCWKQTSNDTKNYASCKQPCDEGVYDAVISEATWPKGNFLSVGNSKNRTVYTIDEVKQMAQLEVYFQQLDYERMYEKPDYTFTQLFSEFGAQIGLWVGISIVSIIEFVVLGVLVCIAYCWPDSYDNFHL
uniref:Uncharacterized protein n=1 Tax=Acrobeloides nanus TaxID=290746 RepID=A0A914DV03_9BILA